MTAPQATDPAAWLDRLEETWKAATAPEEFWERCGCLKGLGEIPSVSDCHQAGLCQMRRSDRERNASVPALIAALRGVLAKCDTLEAAAPIGRFFAEEFRAAVAAALGAEAGR